MIVCHCYADFNHMDVNVIYMTDVWVIEDCCHKIWELCWSYALWMWMWKGYRRILIVGFVCIVGFCTFVRISYLLNYD